jgi:hypothetical protein
MDRASNIHYIWTASELIHTRMTFIPEQTDYPVTFDLQDHQQMRGESIHKLNLFTDL